MYTKIGNIYPRDILNNIMPYIDRDEIVVILGAHQIGKSSLLHYLQHLLKNKGKKTFYIDFEDIDIRNVIKSPNDLILYLKGRGYKKNNRAYVFLDEIHYLKNWNSILKFLQDHNPQLKFFITGSSSIQMKIKMGEPKAGGKVTFILFPLSFSEFLNFNEESGLINILKENKTEKISEMFTRKLIKRYEDYVIWGGYPRVVLTRSKDFKSQVLKEIFVTYIEKEVLSLIKRGNRDRFEQFLTFLSLQNGNLYRTLEVSKELSMNRATALRYLKILQETYIVKMLVPLFTNKHKEITRTPKLYFFDTGFLHFARRDFRPLSFRRDVKSSIETLVLANILKDMKTPINVYFWRSKEGKEVDFIIRKNNKYFPIEVNWSDKPGLSSGFYEFIEKYNSKKGFVLTKSVYGTERYNRKLLQFIPSYSAEYIPEAL